MQTQSDKLKTAISDIMVEENPIVLINGSDESALCNLRGAVVSLGINEDFIEVYGYTTDEVLTQLNGQFKEGIALSLHAREGFWNLVVIDCGDVAEQFGKGSELADVLLSDGIRHSTIEDNEHSMDLELDEDLFDEGDLS